MDDMQAYPTPKSTKESQAFEGTWRVWRTFTLHLAVCHHPLYHLVKSTEQQAAFGKAKILMIKALNLSQVGLLSELDVSVTLEAVGWAP